MITVIAVAQNTICFVCGKKNSWLMPFLWDTLIAPMIIRQDILPPHIYRCVHFSLQSSLLLINNVHKCAWTPQHTP